MATSCVLTSRIRGSQVHKFCGRASAGSGKFRENWLIFAFCEVRCFCDIFFKSVFVSTLTTNYFLGKVDDDVLQDEAESGHNEEYFAARLKKFVQRRFNDTVLYYGL
jgi:hypothetical protein